MSDMPRLQIKSEALHRLRLEALMSREELAEKAELSPGRIQGLENDDWPGVKPQTVRKLAGALGCDPKDISEVVEQEASA